MASHSSFFRPFRSILLLDLCFFFFMFPHHSDPEGLATQRSNRSNLGPCVSFRIGSRFPFCSQKDCFEQPCLLRPRNTPHTLGTAALQKRILPRAELIDDGQIF